MKRVIKYMRLVAAIYMALYFLCNAALIHNHIIDGHNISHAHIFKGAQHTADEADLISLLNITPAESAECAFVPEFTVAWQDEIHSVATACITGFKADAVSLRAPPSIQL